jgi:hypothetical protein
LLLQLLIAAAEVQVLGLKPLRAVPHHPQTFLQDHNLGLQFLDCVGLLR